MGLVPEIKLMMIMMMI